MLNFGEKSRRPASINITSLVDILIVLLLFFMLTTQFSHMGAINLNISGNTAAKKETTVKNIPIAITLIGNKKFTIDKKEFTLGQIPEKIAPLLEENRERDIIIINKTKATVQDIVIAMDYIKKAGGMNVSIAEELDNAGK